jgi:hypothetical protein
MNSPKPGRGPSVLLRGHFRSCGLTLCVLAVERGTSITYQGTWKEDRRYRPHSQVADKFGVVPCCDDGSADKSGELAVACCDVPCGDATKVKGALPRDS